MRIVDTVVSAKVSGFLARVKVEFDKDPEIYSFTEGAITAGALFAIRNKINSSDEIIVFEISRDMEPILFTGLDNA